MLGIKDLQFMSSYDEILWPNDVRNEWRYDEE